MAGVQWIALSAEYKTRRVHAPRGLSGAWLAVGCCAALPDGNRYHDIAHFRLDMVWDGDEVQMKPT